MAGIDILNDWKTRTCVLATMHGKEAVITPPVSERLGLAVMVPKDFNTDRFGTFTRDVERVGSQRDAARAKALAALAHTGADLAIASEGSFGTHPDLPILPSALELVLLIDTKHNLEIVGHFRTSSVWVRGQAVTSVDEAVAVASSWGFPEQGVIVRRGENNNRDIYKDITTVEELRAMAEGLLSGWFTRSIFLETDMRAHRCPARMESIQSATLDLIKNCELLCPQCGTPGFVVTEVKKGLPCGQCKLPTDRVKELVHGCQRCGFTEVRPVTGVLVADPGQCEWCNP